MKLRSRPVWQKAFAAFMMFALLSIPTLAQSQTAFASSTTSSLTKTEKQLTKQISKNSIIKYTKSLSSDKMEGRGTMQAGGDRAAMWIAEKFESFGLTPLGDNDSFLQSIDFKETSMGPETMFQVGEDRFTMGKDYGLLPLPFKKTDSNTEGDLVFIGYGLGSLSSDDPADALKAIKGKIVVRIDGPPIGISQEKWDKGDFNSIIFQTLIIGGAKAIIIVGNGREGDETETYIDYFGRRQVSLADEKESSFPISIPPMLMISQDAAKKLFETADVNFEEARKHAEKEDFTSIDLKQTAKLVTKYNSRLGKSNNVVGYLEGSDPTLKAEAVLFSAHYDAYGIDNGQIFNGAADNALGTAEMLAVAKSFSKIKTKPKRSLIFLAVTGEEYGLYGSKHWANNPTWDITKVAANLNLDGIGTEVYGRVKNMVGFGAEYSTLGKMLDDVANSYGINIMPDPQPEEKVFTRSDHYSFVERGVPALMLMGAPEGTKEELVAKIKAWEKVNYHQPTDDVMKDWHWNGAKTVADMMGVLGLRIANQAKMPEWLKGTRFEDLERGNTEPLPEEK